MKPKELYEAIRAKHSGKEVNGVCFVSECRKRKNFCEDSQCTKVLDFDSIKDMEYKIQKKATPASVDAICISGNEKTFCFVELKGWQRYIEFFTKHKRTIPETTQDYNLAGKLSDSQDLCESIVSNRNVFVGMPICFILVTDIDTSISGVESFHSMMNDLATGSTDLYMNCLSEAQKTLDSDIHIDHHYVTCKQFDKFVKELCV